MSFDNRLRDELREAADAHDLREEIALQHVKATQPTEWTDLTVVALESSDPPRSQHAGAQRIVGALAACALVAGAIALPVALHSRSRDAVRPSAGSETGKPACVRSVATGYRSTVVIRVAEAPSSPPAPNPATVRLAEPTQFALGICNAALARSHVRSGDPAIGFDAVTNASGDTLSLTVITPTAAAATTLARNWAELFHGARIAAAKQQIRQQQHQLALRVKTLHDELRRVDEQLVKMMPFVYKDLLAFDAPNGNLRGRGTGGPPPVPEQGSPKALNLAFERIQLLSSLTETGEKAAALNITVVKPDVYATIVSQSPAVLIKPPHQDSNTSTVLIAVGLLLGGVLLAGSAFWLGRRSGRPQPS